MAETSSEQAVTKIKSETEHLEEEDDKKVSMYALGIGENDPKTNSLVALEMKDTKKTGFRGKRNPTPHRKKSIDGIFGKMNKIDVEDNLDKTPLKSIPRRSLMVTDPSSLMDGPDESDSD